MRNWVCNVKAPATRIAPNRLGWSSARFARGNDAIDVLDVLGRQLDVFGGVELMEHDLVVVAAQELLDQAAPVRQLDGDEAILCERPIRIHEQYLAGEIARLHAVAVHIKGEGVGGPRQAGGPFNIFLWIAIIEIKAGRTAANGTH